jgi:hypothetical protein
MLTASACKEGDTGAGSANQENPVQKAADDARNYVVYLEVECDPSNHPWTLSYRCGGEEVLNRHMSGSFAREIMQTGSAEISIRAKQKEQGTLRPSISIGGTEVDYDITRDFNGEAWCSYKPGAKPPNA